MRAAPNRPSASVRRAALAVGLAALVSACGSTAQVAVSGAGAPLAGDGLGQTPGLGDGAAPSGPTTTAPTGAAPGAAPGPGSATAPRGTTPSAGGAGGSTGGTGGTSGASPGRISGALGPGISATQIRVGVTVVENAEAYYAALGASGQGQVDTRRLAQAYVDHLNATGGLAGRKVVPVYGTIDATDTRSTDTRVQELCARYTQDDKVFAIIGGAAYETPFNQCTEKAGAIVATPSLVTSSEKQYARYPHVFDQSGMSVGRLSRTLVPALVRQRWFSPWNTTTGAPGTPAAPAKVGIVVPDRPSYRDDVPTSLLPALKRAGYTVAPEDVVYYRWPQSSAEQGQTVTEIQSSVLAFASRGITHVLPLEVNGLVFFAAGAERQGFRPRYAINSATGAQNYAGSLLPVEQLRGALGFGWSSVADLRAVDNPDTGPFSNDRRRLCVQIAAKAGQSPTSNADRLNVLAYCDSLLTLKAILDGVPRGTVLNQTSAKAAMDALTRFPVGSVATSAFGVGRRDGADTGLLMAWSEECACQRYSGQPFSTS